MSIYSLVLIVLRLLLYSLTVLQSVVLDRLAFYLDSDIVPWQLDKPWEHLVPSEWVQVDKVFIAYKCDHVYA